MDYIKNAEKFAKEHGVSLQILGSEFKSMPWDTDNQKRNVFRIKLSRNGDDYEFDYGTSVVDSCAMVSKLSQLKESDIVTIYAGLKSTSGKIVSAGINIRLTKSELLNTGDENLHKWEEQLKKEFYLKKDIANKKWYKSFEEGKISKNYRDKKLIGNVDEGMFIRIIQDAIKREILNLETEMVYSRDLQGEQKPEVTMYDALSALTKYCPETFEDFCCEFGYDTDSRKAEQTFVAVKEEAEAMNMLFGDIMDELNEIE